jgi:hypothetical protein
MAQKHRAILARESRAIFFAGFRTRLRLKEPQAKTCQAPAVPTRILAAVQRMHGRPAELKPDAAPCVRELCGARPCPMRCFATRPG